VDIEASQSRQRVEFLNVPIDIIAPDQISDTIYEFLDAKEGRNIVLLSLWDLLRARRNNEYGRYVRNAALVIPISKSIVKGIRFLTGEKAYRYMPFEFIINVLGVLEKREFSCYILGCKKKVILKAERNIRQTFPKLLIVGRFAGYFKKQEEPVIIEAIRKASPALLLAGRGLRGEERWIARSGASLGNGLRMWCSDLFDVFAERKKHPSRAVFDSGLEWVGYCFQEPVKFFRVFPFIFYNLLLLKNKLFAE
jgi:N-acetylglucosaminyldiphosphoundecaprenol N-acetyl-beta-D-mannosaminyltransferase